MRQAVLVGLGSFALVAACSVDTETQVTVALSSETEIPRELDSFSLRVISTRTGELRFAKDYFPESGREFPTTLAVIPLDEDSLTSPVRIELEGRKDGVSFLRRDAVVPYVRGRNLLLAMPLRMACFQFRDCGPNATCAGGQCVPAEIDALSLPDFDGARVFAEYAPLCFDEERCLGEEVQVRVETDCTFELPRTSGAPPAQDRGNVSIRWAAAPSRLLALEGADAQEGWVRIASERGRLSQGACDSHFRRVGPDGRPLVPDWAKEVYFSASCATKTTRVPYCLSPVTGHAGIGAVRPPK